MAQERNWIDWIEERTGFRKIARAFLNEPIRGGARFAYVFGSGLLFLFVLQMATGIFLTMYYVPSADHAHVSVAYIQKAVAMGALVRGLHHYGASAMLLLLIAHLTQVYLFGAYKPPRELVWIAGVCMIPLVLGLAFTGYLLPWDQEAYFGTKVGVGILGEIPLVGRWGQRFLLGGRDLTTLTLSRFFVLHVLVLPLILAGVIALHLFLFRRAGAAGPYHHRDDHRVEPFYPHQLFKDMLFIFIVFLILMFLAVRFPAPLGPQADPTSDFLARPPWYFLPLFQLLKYFPGKLALIPAAILPALVLGALFLLPFLDRRPERHPWRRPVAVSALAFLLGGSVALGALSKYQDLANPDVRARLRTHEEQARAFLKAPFIPQEIGRSIPIEPPTVKNPPVAGARALKIYLANCAHCHGTDATGGPLAPSLVKLAQRKRLTRSFLIEYLAGHGREPTPGSMPKFAQLTGEDLQTLADWLLVLEAPLREIPVASAASPPPFRKSREKAARFEKSTSAPSAREVSGSPGDHAEFPPPPAAFMAHCAFCHGARGEGKIGPPLIGVADKPQRSREDLVQLLLDPRAYGLKDPMPARFPALTEKDIQEIVEWLLKLK